MKTKHLLIVLASISVLISCEQDSDIDTDPVPTSSALRIKQIINYDEENKSYWKTVFTYEGEKLINYIEYSKNDYGIWIERHKQEISYAGDTATASFYYIVNGSWALDEKHVYVFQNGLIMEDFCCMYDMYGDGSFDDSTKYAYQYSGTNLTAWQSFSLDHYFQTLKQDGKGEYSYQNGKLSECITYKKYGSSEWQQYQRSTFTYNDSLLIGYTTYRMTYVDGWNFDDKYEYTYSGDTLTQRDLFTWTSDSTWGFVSSESYSYNRFGDIVELLFNNGRKISNEYEEGNGNAKLFYYQPSYLVYKRPALRSASTTKTSRYIPYHERLNGIIP